MIDIHFAAPEWVHLLWAVLAFVALLAWLERRGGDALDRFMGATLRARLLVGPSDAQRLARIAFLGASGAFLTLALMRPQWGVEVVESQRAGVEIMICLDVSRSMLAEDVAPNRLERSKAEIRDLLALLDGDQVGLIAFAGRAAVLSPLTPDFGFLRLALDDASPRSVARGGTRLEEPIRKAVAGFGDTSEVSRSILLITDGEDHDSFPLEAAKDAADRGIRILAIGFGAESGSEIPITDAETGARTLLRDADGQVVRSRLDGELLREMALMTSGAYIPAGTGVLELDAIYQRHIAPLTRSALQGPARTVRNDAFQWAVLLGLLALVAATMSTARSSTRASERGADSAALVLILALSALTLTGSMPAHAQPAPAVVAPVPGADDPELDAATIPAANGAASDDPTAATAEAILDDARAAYNDGIAKLEAGDVEAASRLLEAARSQAGTDGEARFRATYNLGWVEVSAADAVMAAAPETALEHLYRAAAWFREAVDLRPGNDDARYNLEIVMRRALELADSLAAGDEGDLLQDLEALIEHQRGFLASLRDGVAAQEAGDAVNVTPEVRRQFRGLAARELTVLADAEALNERAARAIEGINAKPIAERSPQEALRAARLEAAVGHLHHARERAAQARTRLRRMQGERAYRRAAAALGAFQRARDQLLDPVARLDALLADGVELAQLTSMKAGLERGITDVGADASVLDWLTREYLAETQMQIEERTEELHLGLEAGLAAHDSKAMAEAGELDQTQAAEQAKLIEQLRQATPLIGAAQLKFENAADALWAEQLSGALNAQREALEALAAAREYFLDVRGLIELVYTEERRVAALVAAQTPTEDDGGSESVPPAPAAIALGAQLHERNLERTVRLGDEFVDAAIAVVEDGDAAASAGTPAPPGGSEKELYEHAYELLRDAQDGMNAAGGTFATLTQADPDGPAPAQPLAATRASVAAALTQLEELRRLFFSVLEHLRDTAYRQQILADETEALAALADPQNSAATATQAGPLEFRQQNLATLAGGIAEALRAQGDAQASAGAPADDGAAGPDPERLTQAAELVAHAGVTMQDAAATLASAPPALDDTRAAQDDALAELAQAIALLQDDPGAPQKGDQQAQAQQPAGADDAEQEELGETDLAQLLQGVRDREAERREERARSQRQQNYEPVEKDW